MGAVSERGGVEEGCWVRCLVRRAVLVGSSSART